MGASGKDLPKSVIVRELQLNQTDQSKSQIYSCCIENQAALASIFLVAR